MEKVVDYLKQLDLSDVEAKLYLTLLQTGPASVRDLAQTIDIKRTTAYFYIDQLVDKGLIMKLVKGSKKLVAANEPENLQHLVEEKIADAKDVEKKFPDILRTLTTSLPQASDAGNAEVRYYKGVNGVKKIYEEALNSDELRSYVNIGDVENFFPENVFSFDKAFEKNKDLKLYEFVEDSPASHKLVKILSQNKRYNFKFLPKDIKINASDILFYDGNVAIINLRESTTGVVFHNKDYFNISKELFEYMWRTLPDLDITED
jgi:sugar-specific transcriptional regulator TrmB